MSPGRNVPDLPPPLPGWRTAATLGRGSRLAGACGTARVASACDALARGGATPTLRRRASHGCNELAGEEALTENTIRALLSTGHPARAALTAPQRLPLTYAGLRQHVETTVSALNAHGIGRNDRVALVLPNGPELASAFVGIAAGAAVAPLNPAYREHDLHFVLSDLSARALAVEHGASHRRSRPHDRCTFRYSN